jgi:hypothetical protein
MPIVETDPWRTQYFNAVTCPDDVLIPTDDQLAYQLFPEHRWVYNKLSICETQNLPCAPHDIVPPDFPVFSKPIYNMRGMGSGSRIIETYEHYRTAVQPGHMWMPLLSGEHVSTDAAVIDGEPVWWRHTVGATLDEGKFDYWTILAEARSNIEQYCGDWLRRHLKGYTGCVNFETIGVRIIEAHLRFADQWPDLYGAGWIKAMVDLYARGQWSYRDDARETGYSVVLFGAHGSRYRKPDPLSITEFLAEPGISSIQLTFHEDKASELHSMPPGGFRLAVINCWDLQAGLKVREHLGALFQEKAVQGSTFNVQRPVSPTREL